MMKFIFTLFACVTFTIGVFSQSVPSFTTIPGTGFPPVGRAYDEIKGVFEMNGFEVVSEETGGGDQLTITKGTEWLTVYHYPDDSTAASAIASVKTAAAPHTIFTDGSNLYWGTDEARHVYGHAIELDRLLAKNPNHVHLLRAVQIANHTIWKYTSYDDWKNNRILNPRPKFNIHTGETVGRSYNCYEYTNIIEMLLVAMKSLQAIKDLPDADPVYTQLFHFYEQLVWDACTINLDYYKGFSVFTSTTRADVRWENIIGVPRQTKIDPLHYDVSGRQNVYDDQMWLIRCFLEAYFMLEKEAENLTGNDLATNKERREWYLDYSEYLTSYCLDGWDQSKQPNGEEWGGILWGPGYSSKHTCSNSPLISPLVWLAEIYKDSEEEIEHLVRGGYNTNSVVPRSTLKREYYLNYAVKLYDFVYNSFKRDDDVYGDMIGGTTTVPTSGPNEGLRTTTAHGNLDQRAYSYNSGSTLSGVADLYRVVEDPAKRKRYFDDLVALSDASFNYFADSSRKEGFYSFPQHRTGKAEFDACLLRAWVEVYIHDIHETSSYVDAFSKTLDFAYDNYYHNGFLPMDHLFGWRPEMIADNNYDNRDDVRISNLRTFNYSAQFAWISLTDFYKTGLMGNRAPSSASSKTTGGTGISGTAATQDRGMYWPKNQAFPTFAIPADTLDAIRVEYRSDSSEESVLFSALQGLVNKTKPSILLTRTGGQESMRWPRLLDFKLREYTSDDKWELVRKYRDKVNGVILYSNEKSSHYRNLATTVAGLRNALPVTAAEYEQLSANDMEFPVLVDLTELPYTTPEDIYLYLYNTYWKDCTKRLLVHHRAVPYIRDIAVAAKAAVIWLDPRNVSESNVLRLYLRDMTAGEGMILGWWPEERSGIGIGTEHGISTVPADYYENATVYAGMSHVINMPVVPKKPVLENKVYLALFLSDGDNIQYCQNAMARLWENPDRGIIPINWTISPALADLGPGLLNYYYKTATPNDFFASGPSGLGYTLLYDAHNYKWNNTGGKAFDEYLKLTQRYLEKSGLRVITVWDEINQGQMDAYATHCRYLYGVTQQDWERQTGKIPSYVKQNKLAFLPNYPCYANGPDVFVRMNRDTVAQFDGTRPIFLTAQGESWRMGPESMVILKERLDSLSPGNIVVCRGDHFFALYNEANGMDFNLTLSPKMKVTSGATTTHAEYAADGTCAAERTWVSSPEGDKWIQFDFARPYQINRFVIRHAGAVNGMVETYRAKSFVVETSEDGKRWETANEQRDNQVHTTDVDIPPVKARYVRLRILDNKAVAIADMEVYGSVL